MDPADLPILLGGQVTGNVIVAPGCRFREDLTDESGKSVTNGCDGRRLWMLNPRLPASEARAGNRPAENGWQSYGGSPQPPFPQMLSPSWLLTGFALRIDGAATVAGREGWRVVAIPEPPSTAFGPQRFDLTVDAELGILLHCESFVRDLSLWLVQLDAVRVQPAETADDSLFAVPPDALPDAGDDVIPRGLVAAAGLAADALAFAIRHGPGPRRPAADDSEPMPHDAEDIGYEHWPPLSAQMADLLHRAGSSELNIAADLHEWASGEAFTEGLSRGGRALGLSGAGRLARAISDKTDFVAIHRVARVSYAADGLRYRLDWVAGAPRRKPVTESCDGETRWRLYPDRTLTGPAGPAPSRITDLLRPSWLLECRLAEDGPEIVGGRPGVRLRATRMPGVGLKSLWLIFDAAVAVIDAELGVITRVTSYAAGRPVQRCELRDLRIADSTDPEEFRVQTPPGGRIEQETGPFDEAPESVRQVVRAAEQVGRIVGPAASRAADFLGSLKSRGRQ